MNINSLWKLCTLLALFALPGCSRPYYYGWDEAGTYHHARKKKSSSFGFVPLYTEDDFNSSFVSSEYDSKEEKQYRASHTATFRNITFATDSYTIKGEENLAILTSLVHYMKKTPKATLYIEGHTDERGAASYNLALGARRANAIKEYLVKQGISSDRLSTISYGKEQPLNTGHNELAWQQNRRTEFKIHAR
ncbi:15 kDa peptidoglycan-associated lipoprotein,peptidoglycan-associated outer membrane lipoprotein,Outer membrane protein and related peptidoglycan-associated (lipo)proteins,peptidoglycan-associated lipoprotein,OmpA family [Chlamydia serpentis]|uniref:Peptidoglycan-associated protein n=1 Tax=Chlamydia serpentis TaxID=1967782 RepID=A0A2R8FBT5_9CHLA|nr:OmpA family protein [Chlamydia serpentis]SPN73895.1 15 kDa peptidoglycan-associated lipoprotein,peptidoglycan-associated outer membrane lipoprotein,Outer membrane protein and related peptidoglycan-associated (lipo)proteins,peptidoglycan-associated lipoprotein,OmpA family [Chlamydia serpentis]